MGVGAVMINFAFQFRKIAGPSQDLWCISRRIVSFFFFFFVLWTIFGEFFVVFAQICRKIKAVYRSSRALTYYGGSFKQNRCVYRFEIHLNIARIVKSPGQKEKEWGREETPRTPLEFFKSCWRTIITDVLIKFIAKRISDIIRFSL